MARDLSPFTRLTLLISELRGSKIEELADVKKCDLAHHAGKLRSEFSGTPHQAAAEQVGREAATLLSDIKAGETGRAEEGRQALLSSCKKLKDLL